MRLRGTASLNRIRRYSGLPSFAVQVDGVCVTKLELGGDAQLKVAAVTAPKPKPETVRALYRLPASPRAAPADVEPRLRLLKRIRALQFYEVALLLNQKLDIEVTAADGVIQKVRGVFAADRCIGHRSAQRSSHSLSACGIHSRFESGRSASELHQRRQCHAYEGICKGSIPAAVRPLPAFSLHPTPTDCVDRRNTVAASIP